MWSDGATCGYCSCLPTRHSKKDARYPSDSIAGTSESASPEKWKDEDLGCNGSRSCLFKPEQLE